MKSRLFVIRHGETTWNKERRLQGHMDIPLNEQGLKQAQYLAHRLNLEQDLRPIHAIYSSDLSRAYITAQTIAKTLGLSVTMLSELRERHYGLLEGLTPHEIEQQYPEHFIAWHKRDPHHQFVHATLSNEEVIHESESLWELKERISRIFKMLAQKHPQQNILVVVHGGVLDILHRLATGQSIESTRNFPLGNASINQMIFDHGTLCWSIESWGDIAHLPQSMDEVDSKVTYLQ